MRSLIEMTLAGLLVLGLFQYNQFALNVPPLLSAYRTFDDIAIVPVLRRSSADHDPGIEDRPAHRLRGAVRDGGAIRRGFSNPVQ